MRTAKSCGPGAPTLVSSLRKDARTTVATRPGTGESAKAAVKTIARGRPDCLRWTCMLVCALLPFLHARPGAQRAPGFPCALCFREGNKISCIAAGAYAQRHAEHASRPRRATRFAAMRARGADPRSNPAFLFCCAMDCFAPLAMTMPRVEPAGTPCEASRHPHRAPHPMTAPSVTPSQVRCALLLREEIALLDLRHEAAFATGHPLFAANMAADRIALEAETRLPRKDVPIVVYDAGEGLVAQAADRLQRWDTPTFASSTAGCRPGRWRATNCSRTSTPTPRRLANWSSRAGTRRRCPPTKSPR